MHEYMSKCWRCRASINGDSISLPIKRIWHDWAAHKRIFTDAWNPVKIINRCLNSISERKNDEFISGLTKHMGLKQPPSEKLDET